MQMMWSHALRTCGWPWKSSRPVSPTSLCTLGTQPWGFDKMQILTQQLCSEARDSTCLPQQCVCWSKPDFQYSSRTTLTKMGTTISLQQPST